MLEPEVGNIDGYRALVDAITSREPGRAEAAARELLAPATAALLELCQALEGAESDIGEGN